MVKKCYLNSFPNPLLTVDSIPSSLNMHDVYPFLNITRSSAKWLPLLGEIKLWSFTPIPYGLDEEVQTSDMEDEIKCEGSFHAHPLYVGSSKEEGVK